MGLGEATEVPVEAEEAVTGRPAGSKAPTALIIGINILQRFVVFYSNCQYFDRVFWEGHNLGTGHATKWDEFLEKFERGFQFRNLYSRFWTFNKVFFRMFSGKNCNIIVRNSSNLVA